MTTCELLSHAILHSLSLSQLKVFQRGDEVKSLKYYRFNHPVTCQIYLWTTWGVLTARLEATGLTFDTLPHSWRAEPFCLLFAHATHIRQIVYDDIWGSDGVLLSVWTLSECVHLTDWSQGQPKDTHTRKTHSTAIAAGEHTHTTH